MSWAEFGIKLHCLETDYSHYIWLYFDNQKKLYENFLEPIQRAKEKDDIDIVTLKKEKGMTEVARHFETDYKIDRYFEITVRNSATIKDVIFLYEEDNSVQHHYDNLFMKNIQIKFRNCNCIPLKR